MCAAIILGISRDNILGYITVTAKDIEDWCVQPKDNVGTKPHLTPNTILFKRFNRAFEKSLHAVFSQFFLVCNNNHNTVTTNGLFCHFRDRVFIPHTFCDLSRAMDKPLTKLSKVLKVKRINEEKVRDVLCK